MNRLWLLVLSVILLSSCYTSKAPRDRERSYSKPYKRPDNELKLNMFLLHGTNNTSFIYYKIDNTQLVYKKSDTADYYYATLRIFYKSLLYPEASQILDSATIYVSDKSAQPAAARDIVGYVPIRATDGQNTYLEVSIEDVISHKTHKHYLQCDRQNRFSQQNFLLQTQTRDIFFTNKIVKGTTVLVTNNRVGFVNAKVEHYKVEYTLPPPPFSDREPQLFPSIPDSSFSLVAADEHSFMLPVTKQGVYYIRLDSVTTGGCTILGVESNFPKVQSHDQMIAAARFLMNKEEYQKLITATDKQAAIEAFWLSLGGSEDRAKELIKRYYNRVQDANTFFTSHMEGWRTDMGMIYLIFGTPAKTYKTAGMETWEYYIQTGAPPLTFRFEKIKNPFSENCFKLQRSINYKDAWTIAVSYWREGRVYLED